MERSLAKGVTGANESVDGLSWNVVGHVYVPKIYSDDILVWHATIPPDTFVPPHIHPTQDEWIVMLEGNLEIEFGDEVQKAGPGDSISLPRDVPHGIFNRSGETVTCIFGVAPSRKLFELFKKLDGVTDPEELVRISAQHEVNFLPPPEG